MTHLYQERSAQRARWMHTIKHLVHISLCTMLLAQSDFLRKAMLFLAYSIFQIQEPAARGCGCIWGAITHSQRSISHATDSPLSSSCRNLPISAISTCPYHDPMWICCSQQPFLFLTTVSPTEEQMKELWSQTLNSVPKERTRIQAAHFLTVASLWPPTGHLTFYLPLSHHHKKLLFILQSSVHVWSSVCKAFEDWEIRDWIHSTKKPQ